MWIWLLLHYALASVFSVPEGISWTSRRRRAPASPARAQTHHFFFSNSECSGRPWLTVLFFWNAGRTAHRWVFDLRRKRALSIVGNLLVVAKEKSFLSGGSWTTAAGPETGRKKKKSVLTIFIFFLFKFPSLFFFSVIGWRVSLYFVCEGFLFIFFKQEKRNGNQRAHYIYTWARRFLVQNRRVCPASFHLFLFLFFDASLDFAILLSPFLPPSSGGGRDVTLCVCVCVSVCGGVLLGGSHPPF